MAAGHPRQRSDPRVLSSVELALRPVRRPGPLELLWCWRWELAITALIGGQSWLIAASPAGLIGLSVTAGAGLVAGTALLCWPPARHCITGWAWCVITPHRVRTGCASAWVQSRDGRLPVVVSAAPTARGERVRLWCRAGITAADLDAARDVLAAACWAAEVRVEPGRRYAHLVTLHVIRDSAPERKRPAPFGSNCS